jgi:hypothetical protein
MLIKLILVEFTPSCFVVVKLGVFNLCKKPATKIENVLKSAF